MTARLSAEDLAESFSGEDAARTSHTSLWGEQVEELGDEVSESEVSFPLFYWL